MLELQVREIEAHLSGDSTAPVVSGALIVEGHPWADSSFDLLHGLDVVEIGTGALPIDPSDLQAG